jgi:hypothetical protein
MGNKMTAPIKLGRAGWKATVISFDQMPNACPDTDSDLCSWIPLLRRTIDALVASDVLELQRLRRCSERLSSLPEDGERAEAFTLHKLLGSLLSQTRRNLHLLRRAAASRRAPTYGSIGIQRSTGA